MKKNIVFAILAFVSAAFICQAAPPVQKKAVASPDKILVAYFSHGGNTKFAAQHIQKLTGGTLYEIQPAVPYPGDFTKCVNRSKDEINKGIKPELKNKLADIKKYDVIFVGSPNWWSTIAPPVSTFLTAYDFSGKTIVPFVTHGGAGVSRADDDIRKLCPKTTVLEYGSFIGSRIRYAEAEITKFVNKSVVIKK